MFPTRARHRLSATAGILALTLVAAGSAACDPNTSDSGSNKPLTKVTLLTGLGFYGQTAYMMVGQDKGFFREEGLDVTIQGGTAGEKNFEQLRSGAAQFIETDSTSAMLEYGSGQYTDFEFIASVEQQTVMCFSALEGSGITANNPKSLEGKTVGYIDGGINWRLAPGYAQLAGFDFNKVKWQPIAGDAIGSSLATNQVAAVTNFINSTGAIVGTEAGIAKKKGKAPRQVINLAYSTYLGDLFGNMIIVTKTYAKAHPDTAAAFSRAIIKSLRWALDNPDEAGAIFYKHHPEYPGGVQGAAGELKAMKPYASLGNTPVGLIDQSKLARAIAWIQAMPNPQNGPKFTKTGVTPSDLVGYDLMPKS